MRRRYWLMLPALAFLACGCAALFSKKVTSISMQTNPSAAEVWIDGTKRGTTPLTLELSNRESYTVTFKKDGQEATATINKSVGAGWVILDVLGGLIPIIIDASTGAWYNLSPKSLDINLAPAVSK